MDPISLVPSYLTEISIKVVSELASRLLAKGLADNDKTILNKARAKYTSHTHEVAERFSYVRTLATGNQSIPLSHILVAPTLAEHKGVQYTISSSREVSRLPARTLIWGHAGAGKTIVMRALFLHSLSMGETLPLFVEARRVPDDQEFLNYIAETHFDLDLSVTNEKKTFFKILSQNLCDIFIDGLDEISPRLFNIKFSSILSLCERIPDSKVFISSRPMPETAALAHFIELMVTPLEYESASAMVSRLPLDAEIKANFLEAFSYTFFQKHKSFASNPLLLNILLLVYNNNGRVSDSMPEFLNDALCALTHQHDATKAYKREMHSGLSITSIRQILGYFSKDASLDGKFAYTKHDFQRRISSSLISAHMEGACDPNDLHRDLTTQLSLFVPDGTLYTPVHRTFIDFLFSEHLCLRESASFFRKNYSRLLRKSGIRLSLQLMQATSPSLFVAYFIAPWYRRFKMRTGWDYRHSLDYTIALQILEDIFPVMRIQSGTKLAGAGALSVLFDGRDQGSSATQNLYLEYESICSILSTNSHLSSEYDQDSIPIGWHPYAEFYDLVETRWNEKDDNIPVRLSQWSGLVGDDASKALLDCVVGLPGLKSIQSELQRYL